VSSSPVSRFQRRITWSYGDVVTAVIAKPGGNAVTGRTGSSVAARRPLATMAVATMTVTTMTVASSRASYEVTVVTDGLKAMTVATSPSPNAEASVSARTRIHCADGVEFVQRALEGQAGMPLLLLSSRPLHFDAVLPLDRLASGHRRLVAHRLGIAVLSRLEDAQVNVKVKLATKLTSFSHS